MILQEPNEILHMECQKANYVQVKDTVKKLQKAWKDYQKEHPDMNVVGMAAPQVGVTLQIFIALNQVFINPTIIETSEELGQRKEGCCSLPELYTMERPLSITLGWIGRDRKFRRATLEGSKAFIIQHEMEHLKGILCTDKALAQEAMV